MVNYSLQSYVITGIVLLFSFDCASSFLSSAVFVPRKMARQNNKIFVEHDDSVVDKQRLSYTAPLACDPKRHRARTVPETMETNIMTQKLLGAMSILTFAVGVVVGAFVVATLTPSILYSKLNNNSQDDSAYSKEMDSVNRSSTERGGSRTAVLALWARSQSFLQKSGGPDDLAPKLLEQTALLGPNVSPMWLQKSILLACGWLSRFNYRLTRHVFEDQVAYLLTLFKTGFVSPLQVRTCWLDDCVETFVRGLDKPPSKQLKEPDEPRANVVILGAGFDTRCYRLPLKEQNIQTYEVDAPRTQDEKKRVLREAKIDTSGTMFCPCNFETESWLECLDDVSFRRHLPTIIVWEGVTMYLPRNVVMDTLSTIASHKTSSPWVVAFDYISDWGESRMWKRAMARLGEPFKFTMTKSDPETLVESCGLHVMEHLYDQEELVLRYLPKHFDGKPTGILGNYGGFVVACTTSARTGG